MTNPEQPDVGANLRNRVDDAVSWFSRLANQHEEELASDVGPDTTETSSDTVAESSNDTVAESSNDTVAESSNDAAASGADETERTTADLGARAHLSGGAPTDADKNAPAPADHADDRPAARSSDNVTWQPTAGEDASAAATTSTHDSDSIPADEGLDTSEEDNEPTRVVETSAFFTGASGAASATDVVANSAGIDTAPPSTGTNRDSAGTADAAATTAAGASQFEGSGFDDPQAPDEVSRASAWTAPSTQEAAPSDVDPGSVSSPDVETVQESVTRFDPQTGLIETDTVTTSVASATDGSGSATEVTDVRMTVTDPVTGQSETSEAVFERVDPGPWQGNDRPGTTPEWSAGRLSASSSTTPSSGIWPTGVSPATPEPSSALDAAEPAWPVVTQTVVSPTPADPAVSAGSPAERVDVPAASGVTETVVEPVSAADEVIEPVVTETAVVETAVIETAVIETVTDPTPTAPEPRAANDEVAEAVVTEPVVTETLTQQVVVTQTVPEPVVTETQQVATDPVVESSTDGDGVETPSTAQTAAGSDSRAPQSHEGGGSVDAPPDTYAASWQQEAPDAEESQPARDYPQPVLTPTDTSPYLAGLAAAGAAVAAGAAAAGAPHDDASATPSDEESTSTQPKARPRKSQARKEQRAKGRAAKAAEAEATAQAAETTQADKPMDQQLNQPQAERTQAGADAVPEAAEVDVVAVDADPDTAVAATTAAPDETVVMAAVPDAPPAPAKQPLFRDEVVPAAAAASAGLAAAPAADQTAVFNADEAARLRREERAARDRSLGKVVAPAPGHDAAAPVPYQVPSIYKWWPSFGFLVLRFVVAGVLGIRAWQHFSNLAATQDMWRATLIPQPAIAAWVQIGLEATIAVLLVLGLGTRLAGFLLFVLAVLLLIFVDWGAVNPFVSGAQDFIGVVDVLLAGVGFFFMTVGGGGAAIDAAFTRARIQRKNDRLFA